MTRGTCIVNWAHRTVNAGMDGNKSISSSIPAPRPWGSSSLGQVTRQLRGTTTLVEVESQFYNSRFVRTLEGPSLQHALPDSF